MNVQNLINPHGNTVANQFIIRDGDQVIFQSYSSKICAILHQDNLKTLVIFPDWCYSMTTRKHFFEFIRQELGIDVKSKDVEKALQSGKFSDKIAVCSGEY